MIIIKETINIKIRVYRKLKEIQENFKSVTLEEIIPFNGKSAKHCANIVTNFKDLWVVFSSLRIIINFNSSLILQENCLTFLKEFHVVRKIL